MSPDDVDALLRARTHLPPAGPARGAAQTSVAEHDADVAAVLAEQARLRERGLPVPSLSAVVVKASALALREHPRVNASWRPEGVLDVPDHVGA